MKIDIRNVLNLGTGDKLVDVKQVMEDDVEETLEIAENTASEDSEETLTESAETIEIAGEEAPSAESVEASVEPEAVLEKAENETTVGEESSSEPEIGKSAEVPSDPDSEHPEPAEEPNGSDEEKDASSEQEAVNEPESETPSDSEPKQPDGPDAGEAETDEPANSDDLDEETAEEPTTPDEETAKDPTEPPQQKEPFPFKETLLRLGRLYGWTTGIAVAFMILLAFTVVYTTMIPREVYATINGEEYNFTTKEYTVEEFLEDEKIAFCDEDYISLPLTTYIYDGMKLEVKHATDFKVTVDGKTKKYKTLDNTVQEALTDVGIKWGDMDIVTPSLDSFMEKDVHIVIQRVEIKQEVAEESIPFKTVTKDDASLKEGTTKVTTEGVNGTDKVTYEVTYIDGVESSRVEIARESVTAAVDQVIANGTRIEYNGKSYSKKLVVKAYSYTGGGRTAMGTRARVGEIAVDPSVIPLGKNVYIEGVGARRAEDTGGNIKGKTIDIYMNTEAECRRWGVRTVTIYIE